MTLFNVLEKLRALSGSASIAAFAFVLSSLPLVAQQPGGPGAAQSPVNIGEQIQGPQTEGGRGRAGGGGAGGPQDPYAAWLAANQELRVVAKDRVGLEGSNYERPELKWTQSSFVQPQMMIHDRFFYDPVAGKYTVDRYLADLEKRYGGIDSVLVWHGYPNIGIDNRNQYELFLDQPGGLQGVRQMVEDFHKAHVRVLFPIYAWDHGTHRPAAELPEAIAEEMAAVGADGINGDTLRGVPRSYLVASDKIGHPLALEPEGALGSEEMLNYNTMTWGYWRYETTPSISRYKWLDTRHMVNICERWVRDHTDALQHAFFNGVGFETWENVWGIWNQLNPWDAEALRRITKIERSFSGLLVSKDWTPYAPTEQSGVFASKWPGQGEVLWTVINRNHYGMTGTQLVVPAAPGMKYFDLWHGIELTPQKRGSGTALSFALDPDGFGAVLQVASVRPELEALLQQMKKLAAVPLAQYSHQWKALSQEMVEIPKTVPASTAPDGMIQIPAATYNFRVSGVEIEGENLEGTDVQYPWEEVARRSHDHSIDVTSFWIDRYPVTNAQFKAFVDATKYRPSDSHNFLKDWTNGDFPQGWEKKPVTWVSLEDARAYAKWAGKRLPHEWEWQYAAQGTDGRIYPWGKQWNPEAAPAADDGTDLPPPSDVDQHPSGASPFGVMDLVGNVWQMTDEFLDEHTRAVILRGGSHYRPQLSRWYFPQAKQLDQHGKLLLMAPSIDRSGTVGFRCVKDAN